MVEKLFVGGEWEGATDSGKTFEVTNPASGEVIFTLPDAGREEMQRAIDAAAAVQTGWSETTA